MAVNLHIPSDDAVYPVAGIEIGVTEAGIRKADRRDLTVFRLSEGTSVAGVFTRNRFCAAPVLVCQEHLGGKQGIRALVINTGNANAGTGEPGLKAANETCDALAGLMGLQSAQILPFSTGVILEPLPVDRIKAGLPGAIKNLAASNWVSAAHGIMTTDTLPKIHSQRIKLGDKTITITGISKGAGMIRPNMATMLSYLATDAGIAQSLMTQLARELADVSFNRITVDGDTSTNDSFIVMATGKSGLLVDSVAHPHYAALKAALAVAAIARFCMTLGSVAGDIALTQGGSAVVLAGGLGLRLAGTLASSGFAQRFCNKGRFEAMLALIPVKLITHPQPGLYGAAAAFARQNT